MTEPILFVLSPERRAQLLAGADDLLSAAAFADNCEQARAALNRYPKLTAVVADLRLEDGNWWSVYHDLVEAGRNVEFIVLLPTADADPAPVLERGAFAALPPPWPLDELRRLVAEAERRSAPAPEQGAP